jgi:6-phosphogluconolactonase
MKLKSMLLVLAVMLAAAAANAAAARADGGQQLTPGAVFTQTNTVPNFVSVFTRNADGTLVAAGQAATGGNGRPAGNPPLGLPTLDTGRDVELSSDGGNKHCLFVTNAGSNTVSSFAVRPDGLVLVDQEPTNGSRPASLTTTQRGPMARVLYVLNSDVGSASIQGYYVSGTCALTIIPGSNHPTTTPSSLPANVEFNHRGTVLSVTERLAGTQGDIDIFPVDANGVAGAPVAFPSSGPNPYGEAWNSRDQLTVSNENIPFPPGSTVSSYQLTKDDVLVPINQVPSSGAACWNVITNDDKFLYVSQPAGQFFSNSVNIFRIEQDGTLVSAGPGQNALFNAIDEALSHDSRYLYVLSTQLFPPIPISGINEYSIDAATGQLTPIGSVVMPGNSTAGLAAW